MEKMDFKVCHITSAHKRYDVRIFDKECRSLAKKGYNVILLVNDDLQNEVIDNVRIISTKYMPRNRFERIIKSRKVLKKIVKRIDADLYHLHDPELLPIGKMLIKKGKKVIFDSHENYTMQIKEKKYLPRIMRNLISKLYNIYETNCVKRFDAVITPCTINNNNPFKNRAKRTVFINNVPILEEFPNVQLEREFKSSKYICYMGSLTFDRGITNLIKATYISNATLVLGGKFYPEEYYNELKSMREFKSVEYKGYLDRNQVLETYKNSVIGISTILDYGQYLKSDNLPTKVYEYMAMGLPVIISDFPYARKVLQQYKFGITVDPTNVEEISEAINYLLDNPEIAKNMGKQGKKAVKELFNWDYEEIKLFRLYDDIRYIN